MPSNNRKTQKRHYTQKVRNSYLMNNTKLTTRKNVQRIIKNKAFIKNTIRSIIATELACMVMKKIFKK